MSVGTPDIIESKGFGARPSMLSSWPMTKPFIPSADVRALLPRAVRAFPSLGWPALALGGVLVGVVALTSDPARYGSGGPASRLVVELPGAVVTLASIVASLAVLLWFAFALALARRRRKDPDAGRALWGVLLFPLLMAAIAFWHRGSLEEFLFRMPAQHAALDQQDAGQSGTEPPTVSLPFFTGAVGALILGAALATLGLACLILFGDRLAEWWAKSPTGERRHPLAAAVDESLDDLRGEADARLAIIRCYRRFEQVLARSRVPRAPWQTPVEFMREALRRLPLPPDAAQQLTRLFERARFSDEPLAPADRDAARGSLHEIRSSLEANERDVR